MRKKIIFLCLMNQALGLCIGAFLLSLVLKTFPLMILSIIGGFFFAYKGNQVIDGIKEKWQV